MKLNGLLLRRKAMTNLDSVLKSRDTTSPTKVCIIKAMVFPVVICHPYGCESWTTKKAECQRTDALKLWGWTRLLRGPWTVRRSNQEINLNIHWKDWCWSWSWNSNTLPANAKSWLIGKDSAAGKDGGQEENRVIKDKMVGWHHWLNGHEFEQTQGDSDSEGQRSLVCYSSWGHKELDTT